MKSAFLRTITAILTFAVLLSTALPVFAEMQGMEQFEKNVEYNPGQFKDVDENEWYGVYHQHSVELACRLGLMKGSGDQFAPTGNVTLAQAITMAARLSAIYNGEDEQFIQGEPWYQVYVDYCMENEIIDGNDFFDYSEPATRAQMAYIFASALPASEFEEINQVEALPDISEKSAYGAETFLLYRAGVLGGNDASGTFTPDAFISRAAAAAIIARVALPEERLTDLHFAAATQEFDQSSNEEDDTQSPDYLWEQYYASGIKIDNTDQLEWMLYYAAKNLIPEFRLNISSKIFSKLGEYVPEGVENLKWSYYTGTYYDTTINPEYSVYGEAKALMVSDLAWEYASAAAEDYYGALRDLLTVIGTSGKSDRDKVQLIHHYMVRNYQYDTSYTKYFFSDLIDSGAGTCQAYSQMFSLLGNMSGLTVQYLSGIAAATEGAWERHAWNRVLLDGGWMYIDVTWDDPLPDRGYNGSIRTDYMIIYRTVIDKDHLLQKVDGMAAE